MKIADLEAAGLQVELRGNSVAVWLEPDASEIMVGMSGDELDLIPQRSSAHRLIMNRMGQSLDGLPDKLKGNF